VCLSLRGSIPDCSKFTAKHLRAAEVRAAEGKMSVTLGLFGPSFHGNVKKCVFNMLGLGC
jgi:hypothetical protein